MAKPLELTGQRFGRMLVLSRLPSNARNNTQWLCRCDCGVEKAMLGPSLVNGFATSCGCYRRELLAKGRAKLLKHGHALGGLTRTYHTWMSMKARCHNPRHSNFKHYGQRGIHVCQRWRDSFAAFLEDVGERPAGCTIDRIDNSKGYEPDNVRWATSSQQQLNRSITRRVYDVNDNPVTMKQIAHQLAMPLSDVYYRLRQTR